MAYKNNKLFARLSSLLEPRSPWAWLLVLATMSIGLAPPVGALPVTYTLVIFSDPSSPAGLTGSLGSVSFGADGKALVTLTFQGNTANVVPWSVLEPTGQERTGYEIRTGTASVEISDSAHNPTILAQGTFDPGAGIFVSIDNRGQGIGFGSEAVWPPTNSKFPGESVYPFGDYLLSGGGVGLTANPLTYDLKSNFDSGLNSGWSCVGFPTIPCSPPIMLPTSAGNFSLNAVPYLNIVDSYFHTDVSAPEPTTLSLMLAGLLGFAFVRFPAFCRLLFARVVVNR